jgi:hypothetical protein
VRCKPKTGPSRGAPILADRDQIKHAAAALSVIYVTLAACDLCDISRLMEIRVAIAETTT